MAIPSSPDAEERPAGFGDVVVGAWRAWRAWILALIAVVLLLAVLLWGANQPEDPHLPAEASGAQPA